MRLIVEHLLLPLGAGLRAAGCRWPATLLVSLGLATSNNEARRLIDGGAVSVNGEKITEDVQLSVPSLIKKGKNAFILVR